MLYLDQFAIIADFDLNLFAVWFFYLGFINGNGFGAVEMKDPDLLYARFLLDFLDFSAACVIGYRFLDCRRYIRPANPLHFSGKSRGCEYHRSGQNS